MIGGIEELADEIREALTLYEGHPDRLPETSPLRRFPTWQAYKSEADATEDTAMQRMISLIESGAAADLAILERMHVSSETASDAVFSTTHKAKGREWPVVCLADDFPDLDRLHRRHIAAGASDKAADLKSAVEDWHVLYVAATRAIDTLVLPRHLHLWLGDGPDG